MSQESTVFRKGLGKNLNLTYLLKNEYKTPLIMKLRAEGGCLKQGRLEFFLAEEFGFCYGVDRAIEYAYATCTRFFDRKIYLIGEIIHNPYVNQRLADKGVGIIKLHDLTDTRIKQLDKEDIIIIPAFGIPHNVFLKLQSIGLTMVDTTCGSVLNVWKTVERYVREGITSVIHGKYFHEETRATASRIAQYKNGKYIIILNEDEAETVCEYIERGGDRKKFLERFKNKLSPKFNPDNDLKKIGFANQTTMLANDSCKISKMLSESFVKRYGGERLKNSFFDFETICSATQDRQNAVKKLLKKNIDLMIVIGGYNSSNTRHLFDISYKQLPAYHIYHSDCVIDSNKIKHLPRDSKTETITENWLKDGNVRIGITAGASTPDFLVDQTIQRIIKVVNQKISYPDTSGQIKT